MDYYVVTFYGTQLEEEPLGIYNNLVDAKRLYYFYLLKTLDSNYCIKKYNIDKYSICKLIKEEIEVDHIYWDYIFEYYKELSFPDNTLISDEKMQNIINYFIEYDEEKNKLFENLKMKIQNLN